MKKTFHKAIFYIIVLSASFLGGCKFFGKLKTEKRGSYPDGVRVDVVKESEKDGHREKATLYDAVFIHYSARLENGKVFADTRGHNLPAQRIMIGARDAVPGLEAALLGAVEGETLHVELAPERAYGANGYGKNVPPNSRIIYEVEIVKVEKRKK